MRRPLALPAVPAAVLALTAVLTPAADPPDLDRDAHPALAASFGTRRMEASTARPDAVPYAVINLAYETPDACKAACDKFAAAGDPLHVVTRYERFATVMIKRDDKAVYTKGWRTVASAPKRKWADFAGRAEVPPPPPPPVDQQATARDEPEEIVRGGIDGLTGRGVVVAVIDSGLDFRHPDFVRAGAGGKKESRLLAFWDTTREYTGGPGGPGPGGFTYPGGRPIGTVFTRADLTADLNGEVRLGEMDRSGHGTGCAGIAAGSGAALKAVQRDKPHRDLNGMDYTGVAPDADLIAVRISERGGGMINAWLINCACQWIDRTAGERPAVISCSYGGHDGGHDGSLIEERWLSDWLQRPGAAAGPARLVFVAAGNEAEDGVHGGVELAPGRDGRLDWRLDEPAEFDVYVRAEGGGVAPGDVTVRPKAGGAKAELVGRPTVHGLSRALVLTIRSEKGDGGIYLTAAGGKTLRADGYIDLGWNEKEKRPVGEFVGRCATNERLVGTPAVAEGAFAVGSYDFNPRFLFPDPKGLRAFSKLKVGALSGYSNAGYVRDGGPVKPELVAPGQFYAAPAAEHGERLVKDMTGRYRLFNGTSAATPYAAGVAALLLQKKPTLSREGFRRLVEAHAAKDDPVTRDGPKVPNPKWGYGKLSKEAVLQMVKNL